jgi:hypothetical protein
MKIKNQVSNFFKSLYVVLGVFAFGYGGSVLAAPTTLANPIKYNDVVTLIGGVIKFALGSFGAIALVMFIVGGIIWMTSQGDPAKVKKGLDTLVWAALGIVVVFSSYALIKMVFEILGAK